MPGSFDLPKLFAEFNVRLPGVSLAIVSLGDWLVGRLRNQSVPGWMIVLPFYSLLAIGCFMLLRSNSQSARGAGRALTVSFLVAGSVLFVVIVTALYAPLIAIITALQGGKV